MKKPKIWIRVCVHLLLCIITLVQSSEFGNTVTDDITRISLLKQNIPKDYRIPVTYIPEDVGGMCWVTLNVFRLEVSLQELSEKFGNISSNKYNISVLIEMLKDARFYINDLEGLMNDFECHYRNDQWQTGRYFRFVEKVLIAARSNRVLPEECDPPPCPTTAMAATTTRTLEYPSSEPVNYPAKCDISAASCIHRPAPLNWSGVVEKSLLSLLVIPLIVMVFLFAWKVKSRRNERVPDENNSVEGGLFAGVEGNLTPPLDETSVKNRLNVIETV
ncbi:hypothetical protein DPEC_G00161890 [Dallia pectoralis]|uniref:Uncharacterized protein n=1 Tax=Dallia pectoralis TaxID=75939 RepID=A0ACC2GGQ7_DALPE|nr:hypothetical protein DPEC_G00161890 [Dallia pectoralis]